MEKLEHILWFYSDNCEQDLGCVVYTILIQVYFIQVLQQKYQISVFIDEIWFLLGCEPFYDSQFSGFITDDFLALFLVIRVQSYTLFRFVYHK